MAEIAIVLATYNGEKYITELLDSLLNQSFQDWKCYIHDDGSKDQTITIINQYITDYQDKFILIDSPSQGSAKGNFLFLMTIPQEPYVAFCDQDDVWLPEKLEVMYRAMKDIESDKQTPCMVYSDLEVVDHTLHRIDSSFFNYTGKDITRTEYQQLLIENIVPGCATMINQSLLQRGLDYKDADNIIMHDWWLIVIAAMTGVLHRVDQSLVLYRQHSDNEVGAAAPIQFVTVFRNIWSTVFGKHRQDIMERINIPRRLAKELQNQRGITEECYEFLNSFSEIHKKGKLSRILFYLKYDLKRHNHRNFLTLFFV